MVLTEGYCCGYNVKMGSFVLLWLIMVLEIFNLTLYSTILVKPELQHYEPTTFETERNICYLVNSVIGIMVSIFGIIGLQKNQPRYLNGGIYFLFYYTIFSYLDVVTLVFFPPLYVKLIYSHDPDSRSAKFVIISVLMDIIKMVISCFFAFSLKICRDAMTAENESNGSTRNLDPASDGYNVMQNEV